MKYALTSSMWVNWYLLCQKSKLKYYSMVWLSLSLIWVLSIPRTSLVAQMTKRLPAMQETWVQSLGQEDLLEKEMATHSSILAWKIPWMEEPGGMQSMGSQRFGHDWATSLSLSNPGKNTKSQTEMASFSPRLENTRSRAEQLPISCPCCNMSKTWVL